jgi:hypothetical protein
LAVEVMPKEYHQRGRYARRRRGPKRVEARGGGAVIPLLREYRRFRRQAVQKAPGLVAIAQRSLKVGRDTLENPPMGHVS